MNSRMMSCAAIRSAADLSAFHPDGIYFCESSWDCCQRASRLNFEVLESPVSQMLLPQNLDNHSSSGGALPLSNCSRGHLQDPVISRSRVSDSGSPGLYAARSVGYSP